MIPRRNLPERNEQNNFGEHPPQRHTFIAPYIITGFCLIALVSCGGPQRLPENVSLDESRSLVKERLIAPLIIDTGSAATLPARKPRRQLLQIRYHQDSLYTPDFISTLLRPTDIHGLKQPGAEPPSATVHDGAENEKISHLNNEIPNTSVLPADNVTHKTYSNSRENFIIRQVLQLEKYLLSQLRSVDDRFITANQKLSTSIEARMEEIEQKTDAYANEVEASHDALSQELLRQKIQIEDEINSLMQDMTTSKNCRQRQPDNSFPANKYKTDLIGYIVDTPSQIFSGFISS